MSTALVFREKEPTYYNKLMTEARDLYSAAVARKKAYSSPFIYDCAPPVRPLGRLSVRLPRLGSSSRKLATGLPCKAQSLTYARASHWCCPFKLRPANLRVLTRTSLSPQLELVKR